MQSLASGHFDFLQNTCIKNAARNILGSANKIWIEHGVSESNFTLNIAPFAAVLGNLLWRNCVAFTHCLTGSLALVVYDFVNQKVVDVFQIGCFPYDASVWVISKLDETNFLLCLDGGIEFVLFCSILF